MQEKWARFSGLRHLHPFSLGGPHQSIPENIHCQLPTINTFFFTVNNA